MIVPARDGPTPPGDHPALLIPHYHHPSCPPSIIEYVVVHELATCTGIIASESWRRVERSSSSASPAPWRSCSERGGAGRKGARRRSLHRCCALKRTRGDEVSNHETAYAIVIRGR